VKRLGLRLHADEEHWIPLSDLMTGLMFLFLLIAIAYMAQVEAQRATPKNLLTNYVETRAQLYRDLDREFHGDLLRWGATLDPNTLSIRFNARNVLFAAGSAELQPRFKTILSNFFPRYVRLLSEPKYRDVISEVRIEGYTSSFWRAGASRDESYIANMALSQDRTRSVLGYVLALPAVQPQQDWLMQVLTANGLSSSHPVLRSDGSEDADASQRVEFRVRTNAEAQIRGALALTETAPPGVAMPPYAPWAQSMIGKPLRAFYPQTTTRCFGYLDGVLAKYGADRPGTKLYGWGFDATANVPVARVLFADASGAIVGAGDGGYQRPDVPAMLPRIASSTTGWQGYAGVTTGPPVAWGVMSAPDTVCRFDPARPSSGEGM
jgi:outer membrane protein OmpA-like peptidoglycan-associated protein